MRASVAIKKLVVNDSTEIILPSAGVLLFVGPNNAGKSQALRDLIKLATTGDAAGVVLESAEIEYAGTRDDLEQTFEQDHSVLRMPTGDHVDLGPNGRQTLPNILAWWGSSSQIVGGYFVLHADTEGRLLASKPTASLNLYDQDPTHPLHRLYKRADVEARLDEISRKAFGKGVLLDVWSGGMEWSLRTGEIDVPSAPRPDQPFLDALSQLPLLRDEGDGVRSMLGLLLTLLTGHQNLWLVDEPEAFLHPPQARYLARILSEDAITSSRTVVLSTHSADIVHGVLEGSAPATVVRLTRSISGNRAAVLDNGAVRRLWDDPLLRYSNLLDGLFTDAAIICESDADCKFFASIRDTLVDDDVDDRRPDLLFASCGGKHRMHVGAASLRAASVPVAVIGDFDVLNDWAVLSRLIESLGGSPSDIAPEWKLLNAALNSDNRTPSVAGIKEAVMEALSQVTEVSSKSMETVKASLKVETGWSRAKNTGLGAIPKGPPFVAATQVLAKLRDMRIHLVPVGEMEDLVPSAGGHGPGWLAEVLENSLHRDEHGNAARDFMAQVLESLKVE